MSKPTAEDMLGSSARRAQRRLNTALDLVSSISWLITIICAHLAIAAVAIAYVVRSPSYTSGQKWAQSSVALLVPLLGAVVVFVMLNEAAAEPHGPDTSRFDRNYSGSGD